LEVNPEGNETTVKQWEVPKEETTVKTFEALKKQYGDQHLAVGHWQQLKKRSQGNGGS
jgi:hypothetical protein